MQNNAIDIVRKEVSRRGFLKGALIGGAALTLSDKLALAEQMATGRLTAKDIHGVGVDPGLVRMALNENPIGPSPRALEAIAENMFDINRYGFNTMPLMQALGEFDGVEMPEMPQFNMNSFFGGGGGGGNAAATRSGQGGAGAAGRGAQTRGGQGAGGAGRGAQARSGQGQQQAAQGGGGGFRRMRTPFLISAGSGQILEVLTLTYLSRGGGEVIEAAMGYQDIARTAKMYNDRMNIPTNVINVPMTKDHKHDLDAMFKAITPSTTMVVITNPNNPTGTLLSFEEIEAFVNKVPKNVIVVIDEAYIHFVRDTNYKTSVSLATQHDNVITVRTFSKVYGMPGMRLGYAVCSSEIQNQMRFYMNGSANLLAQAAGTAAVKDIDHFRRSQEVVWDFRDRCFAEFDKMGLEYIPSESNFFMVNVGREARPIVRELMMQKRVMVSTRGGAAMPNWIRVSSGTERETEVFLNELKDVLSKTL